MKVEYVPLDFVVSCWPRVEGFLNKAVSKSLGEYDIEHLKAFVTSGIQSLYVVTEGQEIIGAATVSFINYPNDRVAFVTSCGGKMIANEEVWQEFSKVLKVSGATKCQGCAKDSTTRLWESKTGFKKVYTIIERNI